MPQQNNEDQQENEAEPIKCWICPAKHFGSEQDYERHTQNIHNGYRFRCDECPGQVLFKDVTEARDHVDDKHDINARTCPHPQCDEQLANEFNLVRHLREAHREVHRFQCELCEDVAFDDRESYEDHIYDDHDGFRVKCHICHRMLKTKLKTHIEYIHSSGASKATCKICNKQYSSKYKLMRHMKSHTDPRDPALSFRCERCDETFESLSKLNYHKTKHQTKVFQCDKCSKMFYRNAALIQHQKVHESQEFVCQKCLKSFANAAALRRHAESHVKEITFKAEEKVVKCKICEKTFSNQDQLNEHVISYEGKGKLKCHICDQSFRAKKALLSHMKTKGIHDHLEEVSK
ncbi:zinc finger protein 845-like [Culex pipiens pallens]|uniref:zinc finger protein 845-like n=1 Tax=Culex pipiens pallens TaxID=42434 RepID=UPI0019531542|nr:zinc finger protein 845-like [Culex pipiens pallens]